MLEAQLKGRQYHFVFVWCETRVKYYYYYYY